MSGSRLVLDFDGVVLDSLVEKFFVGYNAHLELQGQSPLFGGHPLGFHDYRERLATEPEAYQAFKQFVPLIGDLGENAAVFRLIERGQRVADREEFRRLLSSFGDDYADACSRTVLALRREYSRRPDNDELCPPFPGVVDDIKKLAATADVIVCSTKPLENVVHFSERLGLMSCFSAVLHCGENQRKVDILDAMAREQSVAKYDVIFVDDFARHLLPASEAGFQCYFASWGFGTAADERAACNAGIRRLALDEFAAVVGRALMGESREAGNVS